MIRELIRCLRQPLYWAVTGSGLAVRFVMAWLDKTHRAEWFWTLSEGFWSSTGSVTAGFLIVLVLIRLFSVDRESGTQPVILSTAHGRKRLLWDRLNAGTAAAAAGVCLLALGHLAITAALGHGLPYQEGWGVDFLSSSSLALVGTAGFFLMCACVCDIMRSQPAAMCVCGLPFGISYFVNASAVHPPEIFWLIRYGCFSELMRGRPLYSLPEFWAVWYAVLLLGVLWLTLRKRKERKEL